MPDHEILGRVPRGCDYRFRQVHCPHKAKPADITAAKWQMDDKRWTSWTVVDCPLLPAGEMWCDMTCLLQLKI